MANKKPALYYALVFGYHPTLPGRIMGVTSEGPADRCGRRMLYGRDEDSGSTTRRRSSDLKHRFKDWAEVEALEERIQKAHEAIDERYAQAKRAHEFHRRMMMKQDAAVNACRNEKGEAAQSLLEELKTHA